MNYKPKTVDVPHYTDETKRQKQEWKVFNGNNDNTTSTHSYWGSDKIPDMLESVYEQLDQAEDKTEKLDLLIYKQKLEDLLDISKRLGDRSMSWRDENGDSDIVTVEVYDA